MPARDPIIGMNLSSSENRTGAVMGAGSLQPAKRSN